LAAEGTPPLASCREAGGGGGARTMTLALQVAEASGRIGARRGAVLRRAVVASCETG
jgi:hypothetical protein